MAMTAWFPNQQARQIVARIEVSQTKNLGRTPILMPLLGMLGLRKAIDGRQPERRDRYLSDGEVLEALVAHMVNSVGSRRVPLYQLDDWMEQSGLASYYRRQSSYFNDDRFDRAFDRFLPHAEEVLAEVSMNLLGAFHPVMGTVHHDLTSVLFSGDYEGSSLISYGYNSSGAEKKQVNVELDVLGPEGVVVHGSPLAGSENGLNRFAGDIDKTTSILGANQPGGQKLTIVTDRIFADYTRLWGLKKNGHHFIAPLSAKLIPKGFIESLPETAFEPLSYRSQNDPDNQYRGARQQLTLEAPKGVSSSSLTVEALIVHSER